MLQMKLKLANIDYEAVLKLVYPTILEKVSGRNSRNLLFRLITELGSDGEGVLLRLMQKLPEESKDQLVCHCLNSYGAILTGKLNEYLQTDPWGKHFALGGCEAELDNGTLTLVAKNVQADFKALLDMASEARNLEKIAKKVAGNGLLGAFAAKAAAKVAEQAAQATGSMTQEELEAAGIGLLNKDMVQQKLMDVVTKALTAKKIPIGIAGISVESVNGAIYEESGMSDAFRLPEELEDALIKALADFLREK